MNDDFINYGKLIDDAMHVIVKQALEKIQKEGLPGKHHFFISFLTNFPDVELSEKLRNKYPDEMTIVLQHQFEGLEINNDGFSVILSFDNIKEKISIPFKALTAFADPSVKFGLQFSHAELSEEELTELEEELQEIEDIKQLIADEELDEEDGQKTKSSKNTKSKTTTTKKEGSVKKTSTTSRKKKDDSNVISFSSARNNKE